MRAAEHKLRALAGGTAADIAPEHLACRDFGHAWSPFRAEWRASERAYFVELRCSRCGTLRDRVLDRYGQQISNRYQYAEHYLVKGAGRMTGAQRDAVRLASVQRLLGPHDTGERERIMREIVIRKRCDQCADDATSTFVIGIADGERRPQLHMLDMCEKHSGGIEALAALLHTAAPYDMRHEQHSASSNGGNDSELVACELCDKTYFARGSLVEHVWRKHIQQKRPIPETTCPDCGKKFERPVSVGVHRSMAHGYDALAEAYEVQRATKTRP